MTSAIITNTAAQHAQESLRVQSTALAQLATRLDQHFILATQSIIDCTGRVIVCGMGKSGLIGQKMAATFASTGTPSFALHPGEAFHGDLGMIQPEDLVILLSYSGETDEVLKLIPSLKDFGNKILAITGNPQSSLARHADIHLDVSVERETCPNNLAPTTSTIATMAMGDALAVALMKARNFQPGDFARFHPGGSLGRRLLTRVRDVMHADNLPQVLPSTPLRDILLTMTQGRLGIALVMQDKTLQGIITDGDLRRAMLDDTAQLNTRTAADLMTANPITIQDDAKIVDAEQIMMEKKIKILVATDAQQQVTGVLEIFDN